jgi:hypothetical protein
MQSFRDSFVTTTDVSRDQLREELINVCSQMFNEPSEVPGSEEMTIFVLLI